MDAEFPEPHYDEVSGLWFADFAHEAGHPVLQAMTRQALEAALAIIRRRMARLRKMRDSEAEREGCDAGSV